jgi:hypothetical protein
MYSLRGLEVTDVTADMSNFQMNRSNMFSDGMFMLYFVFTIGTLMQSTFIALITTLM